MRSKVSPKGVSITNENKTDTVGWRKTHKIEKPKHAKLGGIWNKDKNTKNFVSSGNLVKKKFSMRRNLIKNSKSNEWQWHGILCTYGRIKLHSRKKINTSGEETIGPMSLDTLCVM